MNAEEMTTVEQKPKKKPFYKKWWVWVIVGLIICSLFANNSEPSDLIEMPENQYRESCQTYTYDEIARNPEKYEKSLAKFTGEVIQVIEDDDQIQMRVDVTKEEYGYTDTIFVFYTKSESSNILEDDIITMYGELRGMQEYEGLFGQEISIPRFYAKYIDIVS